MRNPIKSRDATIQLAASLTAASRRIGREVARMVIAQLLRRLAAYERSQCYSSLKLPQHTFR
jgi:hypothetical protein